MENRKGELTFTQLPTAVQRWVQPRGTHNSVLKIEWVEGVSRDLAAIATRTTRASLEDPRSDAEIRAATWEGREHDSTETVVLCPRLRQQVLECCERMRAHVYVSSGALRHIKRMTCLFKVAAPAGRLVFLWCPSLCVVDYSPFSKNDPLAKTKSDRRVS